MQKLMNCWQ